MPAPFDPIQHRASTRFARAETLLRIDALIAAEMHQPLQLDEISRRVNVSRRQLQRIYAESTQMSFRTHLRRRRMERAAVLLRSTDLRIVDVAERVGYQQPAQFAKAFRMVHGASPGAYRDANPSPARRRSLNELGSRLG